MHINHGQVHKDPQQMLVIGHRLERPSYPIKVDPDHFLRGPSNFKVLSSSFTQLPWWGFWSGQPSGETHQEELLVEGPRLDGIIRQLLHVRDQCRRF